MQFDVQEHRPSGIATRWADFSQFVRGGLLCIALAAALGADARGDVPVAGRFEVALPAGIEAPDAGRLFVFLSARAAPEPRLGPNWFKPEPFFGIDVEGWAAGQHVVVDRQADGYPATLDQLPSGTYFAQAVLHTSFDSPFPGRGAGNLYSQPREFRFDAASEECLVLELSETVAEEPFPASDRLEEIVLPSELLSRFAGRTVVQRAAIALPESYADSPERRYGVIYEIPGFGGSHRTATRYLATPATSHDATEPGDSPRPAEFIRVLLAGQCAWGHHVYADSATNGPRATALVEELIPYIDAHYRTIAEPTARFLTGHSSGGWASLWLQVRYPGTFGGVWSTAPDPVDFRDYQGVDLYATPPQSLYVDPSGMRRPIARRAGKPVLWYDDFARMDDVLKRGGQLRSFEAVFSPRGPDGEPLRLWDRTTGRIDPAIATAWEAYDIRLVLERNWDTLGPLLAGKLHVIAAGLDTFYLDGAVRRLAESLDELGSDAVIEVDEDKDHATLLNPALRARILTEITETFHVHHPLPEPAQAAP
ncbi:MAG: hypothetical protein K1X74_11930 [Pirellulales bacterium]|nr:hypothetical protein [Pirellulales bacterium]